MAEQFDLEAFKRFVASKPAGEAYNFYGCLPDAVCALSQFSLSVGVEPGTDRWVSLHADIGDKLHAEPWTFGALSERLSRLSAGETGNG